MSQVPLTTLRLGPGHPRMLTAPCPSKHAQTSSPSHCRVAPEDVEKAGEGYVLRADRSVRVASRAHKMSKSRGNVVNPDDVVAQYGADSLRLYEMFMGPLRDTKASDQDRCASAHNLLHYWSGQHSVNRRLVCCSYGWTIRCSIGTTALPPGSHIRSLPLACQNISLPEQRSFPADGVAVSLPDWALPSSSIAAS